MGGFLITVIAITCVLETARAITACGSGWNIARCDTARIVVHGCTRIWTPHAISRRQIVTRLARVIFCSGHSTIRIGTIGYKCGGNNGKQTNFLHV